MRALLVRAPLLRKPLAGPHGHGMGAADIPARL